MNGWRTWVSLVSFAAIVAAAGAGSFAYVPATAWSKASPGLFVVISVLAAAVLVRLARPSPFSNPDVFTDENVDAYFSALEVMAKRLAVVLGAAFISVVALVYVAARFGNPIIGGKVEGSILSAVLGVICSFLFLRLISIVKGDIGFIRLQRRITSDYRHRKANIVAGGVTSKPIAWKSAGTYGAGVG